MLHFHGKLEHEGARCRAPSIPMTNIIHILKNQDNTYMRTIGSLKFRIKAPSMHICSDSRFDQSFRKLWSWCLTCVRKKASCRSSVFIEFPYSRLNILIDIYAHTSSLSMVAMTNLQNLKRFQCNAKLIISTSVWNAISRPRLHSYTLIRMLQSIEISKTTFFLACSCCWSYLFQRRPHSK